MYVPLLVEFVRVPYNVEEAVHAIEMIQEPDQMPHEYANMVRAGKHQQLIVIT